MIEWNSLPSCLLLRCLAWHLSKKEPSHGPATAQLATGSSLTRILCYARNNNHFWCTSGRSGPGFKEGPRTHSLVLSAPGKRWKWKTWEWGKDWGVNKGVSKHGMCGGGGVSKHGMCGGWANMGGRGGGGGGWANTGCVGGEQTWEGGGGGGGGWANTGCVGGEQTWEGGGGGGVSKHGMCGGWANMGGRGGGGWGVSKHGRGGGGGEQTWETGGE